MWILHVLILKLNTLQELALSQVGVSKVVTTTSVVFKLVRRFGDLWRKFDENLTWRHLRENASSAIENHSVAVFRRKSRSFVMSKRRPSPKMETQFSKHVNNTGEPF